MGYISKNLLNRYKGIDSLSNLNIASIEGSIKSTNICKDYCKKKSLYKYTPLLNVRYRNSTHNAILYHSNKKNILLLIKSFFALFKYGFSKSSFKIFYFSFLHLLRLKRL